MYIHINYLNVFEKKKHMKRKSENNIFAFVELWMLSSSKKKNQKNSLSIFKNKFGF